jgi:HEAT repeat protein
MVRYLAIECLGNFHEAERIKAPWPYPFLNDSESLVRIETLESLAQIGDKSALPLISEKLQDENPLVRAYAAVSIGELGGKRYLSQIRRTLESERHDRAKVGLADALFILGDTSEFPLLIELLSFSEYTTRCASANSIADLDLSGAVLSM